jgi:hypothetical protein
VKPVKIHFFIIGAGTTKSHVRRVLGECLQWSGALTFAVAVGIAGIERSIVVEHSSAVDAGHVQFIDDIQLVALSRRAGLAILVATLALSSASFTSASLIIVVKQLRSSLHDG